MIDGMANHSARVRRHIARQGIEAVENFIDLCLSLENLIDPMSPYIKRARPRSDSELEAGDEETVEVPKLRAKQYMEQYINPPEFIERQKKRQAEEKEKAKRFPEEPQRDVLRFLIEHAPVERWQRDVLEIIAAEAYYFAPQAMTKIMNEGWATYWHSKIMTERAASSAEIIDYADACAGVLASAPGQLNPYKLGVELFRHIEMRWDKGQFGKEWLDCQSLAEKQNWDRRTGLGREKIFEVRKLHSDITFIDEYFTLEFCLDQKFYSFGFNERSGNWEIMSREFQKVKNQLLRSLTNRGQPFIYVEDGNFDNRGELLLRHRHEGMDLKLDYATDTLCNLKSVWSRPVNLLTKIDGKGRLLRFDETGYSDKSAEYPEA
jgi:stage V sporulation protein R